MLFLKEKATEMAMLSGQRASRHGCMRWVILGHSERRENCGETSQVVAEKTKFAVENGFSTLTCIGEKLDAREAAMPSLYSYIV